DHLNGASRQPEQDRPSLGRFLQQGLERGIIVHGHGTLLPWRLLFYSLLCRKPISGWPGLSLRSPGRAHRGFEDSAPAPPRVSISTEHLLVKRRKVWLDSALDLRNNTYVINR